MNPNAPPWNPVNLDKVALNYGKEPMNLSNVKLNYGMNSQLDDDELANYTSVLPMNNKKNGVSKFFPGNSRKSRKSRKSNSRKDRKDRKSRKSKSRKSRR